jgi:hypothetical protein
MAHVNAVTDSSLVCLALDRVKCLCQEALAQPLYLEAVPPLGKAPYPYGDLVPLGFALLAVGEAAEILADAECEELKERLGDYLLRRRTRGLWSYHSGALETSIDSGFVLLGLSERNAVAALEKFSDGQGGYVPQLCTDGVEPGRMTMRESLRHWCRPDYSIACLVRALRKREGLPEVTPLSVLDAGFATRSGLYLANPFFPDWLLAMALEADPQANALRSRLRLEISAAARADGTFGSYDILLSTALGLLSLQSLGGDPVLLERSMKSLAHLLESAADIPTTPFYSTEQIAWSERPPWEILFFMSSGGGRQLITSGGEEHVVTLYRDSRDIIASSLTLLALLGRSAEVSQEPGAPKSGLLHGRYQCSSPEDYVARFALPPYLSLPKP